MRSQTLPVSLTPLVRCPLTTRTNLFEVSSNTPADDKSDPVFEVSSHMPAENVNELVSLSDENEPSFESSSHML